MDAAKQTSSSSAAAAAAARPAASGKTSLPIEVDAQTESNHDTALTLAAAGGHARLVALLLSRGADVEHRDKKGQETCVYYYMHLASVGRHLCLLLHVLAGLGRYPEAVECITQMLSDS